MANRQSLRHCGTAGNTTITDDNTGFQMKPDQICRVSPKSGVVVEDGVSYVAVEHLNRNTKPRTGWVQQDMLEIGKRVKADQHWVHVSLTSP